LAAWQSVRPSIEALDRIANAACVFGPTGAFPVVADPRSVDPGLNAGWLEARAAMCTNNDLLAACAAFQKPNPLNDIRTSPWLRVTPFLHTVATAAERLRSWAEAEWAAQEAQRPESGRMIDNTFVKDSPRVNPFAVKVATA